MARGNCDLLFLVALVGRSARVEAFHRPPDSVLSQLDAWFKDGTIRSMVATTLSEAALGYLLGNVIGIVLALCCGLFPSIFGKCVEPVVTALYASPKFVFVPLLFVWLGAGYEPRVVLIALGVFAYSFVNTATGIRTVDTDQLVMLKLLGADRKEVAVKLLLPHTFGYIVTGLTNAAVHAVSIAIGTEILFGTTAGIGGVLFTESELFNARDVLAALVTATVLASIAIQLTMGLGRWVTRPGGRFARY
jgi:NitT/TauT family transport system permease protein